MFANVFWYFLLHSQASIFTTQKRELSLEVVENSWEWNHHENLTSDCSRIFHHWYCTNFGIHWLMWPRSQQHSISKSTFLTLICAALTLPFSWFHIFYWPNLVCIHLLWQPSLFYFTNIWCFGIPRIVF